MVDFYAGNAAGMDAFVRFPCPGNNGQLLLRMALTVETDAASEAMHALGVHLDEEEQRTLDAMIALLNAAEVRIQLGLTGEQLRISLVMSEIELLYLQEDVYQGTRYVTTNLMPGVALTVPQREVWDVAQALWRMDWSGLGQALKSDVEQWALSLDGQYEEGMFLGYAIPAASARTSYSLDDRDLAVLVDAWTNTLLTRTDAAAVADAMYGEGYWNAWLSMVQDFNRQVSWENQYGYDVSVLWDATGEPVGTIISGNLRESQERPWQLSVGWSGQDVDMLATLPQEGEDMLLRYTLSQDQQDGTQTISQRMHLLSAEAGESYDSAAEGAVNALLMREKHASPPRIRFGRPITRETLPCARRAWNCGCTRQEKAGWTCRRFQRRALPKPTWEKIRFCASRRFPAKCRKLLPYLTLRR